MPERINYDRRRFVRSAAMTFAATRPGLIGAAKSLIIVEDSKSSFLIPG
jgi:hypothetical protein